MLCPQRLQLNRHLRTARQQNERLCRSLTRLDRRIEDLRRPIEHELKQHSLTANDTPQHHINERILDVVREYKRIKSDLQNAMLQKVQLVILRVLLNAENYTLSLKQAEQLMLSLQTIPGVSVREKKLRTLLLRSDDSSTDTAAVPMAQIMKLLQQLQEDANSVAAVSPPSPMVSPDMDDDTSEFLFSFNIQQFVQARAQYMETDLDDSTGDDVEGVGLASF